MKLQMITRQQLEIINRKTLKYPLQTAEKDYFLTLMMQIISQSDLQQTLVFKGGTALHHCYLNQSRFSEDLDFTSNQRSVSVDDLQRIVQGYDFLSIKKVFQSDATVKIEKLQVTGPLSHPNSLKIEIDNLQNVLLPPMFMKYHNAWGLDFSVRVMDIREISAEKIRAMSDRARYRDFYDLVLSAQAYSIDLAEVVTYLSQKEIRQPITKANIIRNWNIVGTQKAAEMSQVHYAINLDDAQIENLIDRLPLTEIV